ncbi:MAG: SCO family protein [Thermomicrobiales bacterium]|nr:SCO family protein [Thermomicrobiales bacterium]
MSETTSTSPEVVQAGPSRAVRFALLALIGGLIIGLSGFTTWAYLGRGNDELPGVGTKQVVEPPTQLPDFTLTSQTGQPLSLSELYGKPVLLFFGFTHCPDICPTTLAEFRSIKQDLGDAGQNVAFVFVSVDGSRDTPDIIANYVGRFDPNFIGLTGTEDLVREVGKDYFLQFQRADLGDGAADGDYTVDHTAYTYLIDPEGRLRVIYPFQTSPSTIVDDLKSLL